ncbi:hypothetical protein [Blastopirellula marina]|uniref:Uncharacterized protein n=1 Tax=Blastopirellula marina TaxID=124 RepID=A0A2S8GLP1_9BACT|nr:hypothetical protein [Blastopirellula marina]PQO45241.1 hypothetical protein C5Y93_14860 [Blastopirellula marina]
MPTSPSFVRKLACLPLFALLLFPSAALAAYAHYELKVIDEETQLPCSAKIRITDTRGKPKRIKGALMINGTAYFVGGLKMELRPGKYDFRLDAGPEYPYIAGSFILNSGDSDTRTIELKRFIDMTRERWYPGNVAMRGETKDLETIMMADDLVIGNRITWDNQINPWAGKPLGTLMDEFGGDRYLWEMGGEDDRAGGKLWFAQLKSPLPIQRLSEQYPAATFFQSDLKGAHVTAGSPLEPDLPMWISHDLLDSICVMGPQIEAYQFPDKHPLAEQAKELGKKDVTGKPRLALDIYYKLLETGVRLPPVAANGTDEDEQTSRLDRVYAKVEEIFTPDTWWDAVEAGHTFITNGPLLRATVEGELPGHVFPINIGEKHEFNIALSLATRETIVYLEVIKNGQKDLEISLEEYKDRQGILPPVVFEDSGWFLVRVVTQEAGYYQYAMTAPFYVEANGQPRISKSAAEFFRDWVFRRAMSIDLPDGDQRNEIIDLQRDARDFWQKRAKQANAE